MRGPGVEAADWPGRPYSGESWVGQRACALALLPAWPSTRSLSCRVVLSPRQGLPRTPLRGIFQGAKVVRGPDWEWGSQDGEWGSGLPLAVAELHCTGLACDGALVSTGGEGKPGRVVDIRGWDVETGRSVASVTWADGTTNVYRVGHKGKVDLKCVGEAAGGFYYKEHLPRLGRVWPQGHHPCLPSCPPTLARSWGSAARGGPGKLPKGGTPLRGPVDAPRQARGAAAQGEC